LEKFHLFIAYRQTAHVNTFAATVMKHTGQTNNNQFCNKGIHNEGKVKRLFQKKPSCLLGQELMYICVHHATASDRQCAVPTPFCARTKIQFQLQFTFQLRSTSVLHFSFLWSSLAFVLRLRKLGPTFHSDSNGSKTLESMCTMSGDSMSAPALGKIDSSSATPRCLSSGRRFSVTL
jgi:hypothetical protein